MGVYRKNNRWFIDIYIDGKRRREVVKLEGIPPSEITYQGAVKFLRIKQAEAAKGEYVVKKASPVMFDKLATAFIEEFSKANKKSWKRDVTSCRALLNHFGGRRLSYITPWTVDQYKAKRLKTTSRLNRPITKATCNREIACLKTMLTFAAKKKWIHSNPLAGYKLYKETANKIRVVTVGEFNRVYNEASETLKPILVTAFCTGMRASEILNLKWKNVDLAEGYMRVEDTKNGESRNIPINRRLNAALESVKLSSSGEYVFSRDGERVRAFKTAFTAAVRRSGVERFTFHDLRHTFASNLVMNGVDLVSVGELLGHRSINMTRRYSHPSPDHKKAAVEALNLDTIDTYMDTKVLDLKKKSDASN